MNREVSDMVYSIRMRSSKGGAHECGGSHISGAERLVGADKLKELAGLMIERAFTHTKGRADFIRLTIEQVEEEKLKRLPLLSIKNSECDSVAAGRKVVVDTLLEAGVAPSAARGGLERLASLPVNMRGAMVLCCETGVRLDDLGDRGIRVSRMDSDDEELLRQWLERQEYKGLHVREAIVLASKVLSFSDVVAELCWSDDPEYVTGYVATKQFYRRITPLKEYGSARGGRIFFVKPHTDIAEMKRYLEEQPVLVGYKEAWREYF